jgi:hypothetical protein
MQQQHPSIVAENDNERLSAIVAASMEIACSPSFARHKTVARIPCQEAILSRSLWYPIQDNALNRSALKKMRLFDVRLD